MTASYGRKICLLKCFISYGYMHFPHIGHLISYGYMFSAWEELKVVLIGTEADIRMTHQPVDPLSKELTASAGTTACLSVISLSNLNLRPFSTVLRGLNTWMSHIDGSRLYVRWSSTI
jgi:hypothetical protein